MPIINSGLMLLNGICATTITMNGIKVDKINVTNKGIKVVQFKRIKPYTDTKPREINQAYKPDKQYSPIALLPKALMIFWFGLDASKMIPSTTIELKTVITTIFNMLLNTFSLNLSLVSTKVVCNTFN
jgi:hypothetical protein